MNLFTYLFFISTLTWRTASSFSTFSHSPQYSQHVTSKVRLNAQTEHSRLAFLQSIPIASAGFYIVQPQSADALVKGNAPPPPKRAPSEERKCRNVEECQEMAEKAAAQADMEERANILPASVTPQGTKYRDLVEVKDASQVAKVGDKATIFYKVLKLGKRSYDGLSGEGTVVFSRGYGLEDDEEKPGVKSFSFTVGDSQIISALNDAIVGQAVGSVRRIAIMPQMGWEKATKECDGGPGGSGAGGDLKTDYVVVPTATMVATEVCFDKNKLPFPNSYAEQRRMAQRFDQSLIMEVELVSLN